MIEEIWNGILELTARFVIPDWGSIIALLPVFMGFVVLAYLAYLVIRFARAAPRRRRKGRVKPVPPPGVHMPGPTFAPIFAGFGTFLLFLGLVFGTVPLLLGATALVLTLLYWGREGLRDYDHVVGEEPRLPAVVHEGPPPGVHIPGPTFRPILASLGVFVLFLGLVFGGWLLAVGVLFTIVALLGWLNDARKEYRQVVVADRTGHLENEPPPGWPKVVLPVFAVLVVAAVALDLGWFPPRSATGSEGEPGASAPPSGPPAGDVAITAQGVAFLEATVNAPAGQPFTITFDNRDAAPHDVDILDAAGTKVFDSVEEGGPNVRTFDVPELAAGNYTFICSVHASMKGDLVAAE